MHDMLKGAIVKVQFELHHFRIQKKKVDLYNAKVQQIFVLKLGIPCPRSAFKQWNVKDGPMKRQTKVVHVEEATAVKSKDAPKSDSARMGEDDGMRSLTSGVPMLKLEILPAQGSGREVAQVAESSAQGGKHNFKTANTD